MVLRVADCLESHLGTPIMKLPLGRRTSTSLPTPAVSKPSAARRRARLRDPARKGAAISCFAKFCTRYAPCCSIGPEDSDANAYRCTGPAAPWVRRCFRRASGFDSMILAARLHPGPLSAASFSLCPPPPNKGMHGALCLHQQRLLHRDWEASMPFIILGRRSPIPAPNILQESISAPIFAWGLHCAPVAPNRSQSQAASRLKILNA